MNQSALQKAKSRLRSAQRAAKSFEGEEAFLTFDDNWMDFLSAWKSAYNKIEQAAKDTPQERQWFGAVKRERRDDALLNWLFEARNDEEHGIVQSAVSHPPLTQFTVTRDVTNPRAIIRDGEVVDVVGPDGESVVGEIGEKVPATEALRPVKARAGRVIPAPTSHMGEPIESTPKAAVDLGLRWLEALVATAEAMSHP